ncbi:MAG: hypothetical protein CSA65_08980 [Proteobacteria bacterium]|nr:MAG: hypothetical protein CSB49_07490 [Pseudomonadota bacterium]PIE17418.1 MAG: hypothetical protein CSA65_08980 [Pseudomonadota bacterium]
MAPLPRGHIPRWPGGYRGRRGPLPGALQRRAQRHRCLSTSPPGGRGSGHRGSPALAEAGGGDTSRPPRDGAELPQGRALPAAGAQDSLVKPKPTHADLAGSRHLALQRLARAQKRATAELLQLYVLEGFLRRLTRSRHDERLVLKGGLLLAAFDLRRATRDVDLLALRTDNDPAFVEQLVIEIASVDVDDGVVFLLDTTTANPIRDDDVYPGVRAVLEARLATARIKLSVDVNVGDPVVPAPIRTAVPVLLGDEPIDVLAYPKSMVVAEKLVTALQRGRASTRWRDFADLFVLVPGDLIEDEVIEALRAVASHRGVALKPLAGVLAGMPKEAQARWATWRKRQGAQDRVPEDFAAVLDALDERTHAWISKAAKVGGPG